MRWPHARRPLTLLLVGAGWLSILGNSPGPEYKRQVQARSGAIQIQIASSQYQDGCRVEATLSSPARRVTLRVGEELIHELSCIDGSDCLTQFRTWFGDCQVLAPGDAGTPLPTGGNVQSYRCTPEAGPPLLVRHVTGPRANHSELCHKEGATFRFEAESTSGAQGTLDFSQEVDEPDGYFGC